MLTFTFLLVSSVVWGGLIWITARTLQRSNVSGRARQWIWRGATLLLLAPWVAAPLVSTFGWGLAPREAANGVIEAMPATFVVQPETLAPVASSVGIPVAAAPVSIDPVQIVLLVLAIGWVARFVMAQLAAKALLGVVQYARDAGPGAAQNASRMWSKRLGMKKPPRLKIVAEKVSPFSFGVLRPTICLPDGLEDRLKPEALDLVIAHECTHVARGDGWLRPLERITADLLWFNPFAWLMRRELDVARELACDEAVVSVARDGRVYARTLRDVAGFSVGLPVALPAASMSLAGGSIMLRVTRTLGMSKRKPARLALASACVLALIGAPLAVAQVMFATPAPEAPPAPPAPPEDIAALEAPEAPELPEALEAPEAPEAPEDPEAPPAAELSRDGTVRATFPATVASTTGDASHGYSVRLEGAGEAASCVAQLDGLGSLSVAKGQSVSEGGMVGRRDAGRQMRFDVHCSDSASGPMSEAFEQPPAPPAPPAAPRQPAPVLAPLAHPSPLTAPLPALAPLPPQPPTWTGEAPPAPPTPVTPPSAVAPIAPVSPVGRVSSVAPPAPVFAPGAPAPVNQTGLSPQAQEYAQLVALRGAATTRYGSNHPRMISLSAAVDEGSKVAGADKAHSEAVTLALLGELSRAQQDRQQLATSYGNAHPMMQEKLATIGALERALGQMPPNGL